MYHFWGFPYRCNNQVISIFSLHCTHDATLLSFIESTSFFGCVVIVGFVLICAYVQVRNEGDVTITVSCGIWD